MVEHGSRDPLKELAHENEVAREMAKRLNEVAHSLTVGRVVPPGEIAEGLRLWEQYRSLHERRFHDDLLPEARSVAAGSCPWRLDLVVHDQADEVPRIARAKSALQQYTRGDAQSGARLAVELDWIARERLSAMRYEDDYPLSCLDATLSDEAVSRVRHALDRTKQEAADLERHITHYLSRPSGEPGRILVVHCQHRGCASMAQAETFPAENGHLGIQPPIGWKATSRPPLLGPETVIVEVDFLCPNHAKPSPGPMGGRERGDERDLGPDPMGQPTAEEESCSCRDPLPEDLA